MTLKRKTGYKQKKRREKKFSFDVYYQFCNIS